MFWVVYKIQKWRFSREKRRTWKTIEKVWIASIVDEGDAQTLNSGETVNTDNKWWIPIKHCVWKTTRISKEATQSDFSSYKMDYRTQQSRSRKRLRRLVCQYFGMRLTHQKSIHPIIIYLHRWDMHLLTSASLLTKLYENASMIRLPQKSNRFLG